jgi:hypothetical protein
MNSPVSKSDAYMIVRQRIEDDETLVGMPESGRCLFWAMYGTETLRSYGIRAILQAGSAFWPRLRPDQDDGISNTHFGYQWSPDDPISIAQIERNMLPEMHVWIGIPLTGEIVDFSTKFWPAQELEIHKQGWPGDLPPEFFWDTPDKLPGAWYTPSKEATVYALRAIALLYGVDVAKDLVK